MIKHPQAKFGYEWLSGSEVLFWTNPGAWTDGHSDSSLPVYPQWFRTLWLTTKHPHAQFGYNLLSGSEVLFWTNPGAWTDKHCLPAPPPLKKNAFTHWLPGEISRRSMPWSSTCHQGIGGHHYVQGISWWRQRKEVDGSAVATACRHHRQGVLCANLRRLRSGDILPLAARGQSRGWRVAAGWRLGTAASIQRQIHCRREKMALEGQHEAQECHYMVVILLCVFRRRRKMCLRVWIYSQAKNTKTLAHHSLGN